MVDEIDLDQAAAAELAGKDRVAPVDREIGVVDAGAARGGDGLLQRHCLRIAKVESLVPFGHHDRRTAVRREIEIVGIVDRNGRARPAGFGIDRRQAAGFAPAAVIGDPQGLQIP